MNSKLEEMIIKVLKIENQGYPEEALKLLEKLMVIFPDEQEILFYQRAEIKYRLGQYLDALIDYINAYELRSNIEIKEYILDRYYEPNKDKYYEQYSINQEQIIKYKYYFGNDKYDVNTICPLYFSEEIIIYYDDNTENFKFEKKIEYSKNNDISDDKYILVENHIWISECSEIENLDMQLKVLTFRKPIYYYYDINEWILTNLLFDIKSLLCSGKSIIMIGEHNLSKVLSDLRFRVPVIVFGHNNSERFKDILGLELQKRAQRRNDYISKLLNYYSDELVDKNIRDGNSRILFITSKYTTILQYHTFDIYSEAIKQKGIKARIVIEDDDIFFQNTELFIIEQIYDFRPDIIFVIDHLRYEYDFGNLFKSIKFVTWIQDSLSYLLDEDYISKLGDRDYILNHLINMPDINKLYNDAPHIIDAPIPASDKKYKKYDLRDISSDDIDRYSADICLVCHAADVDNYISETLKLFDISARNIIKELFYKYVNDMKSRGEIIYSAEGFKVYITEFFNDNHVMFSPNNDYMVGILSDYMYKGINQRVYRQMLVDTLLDEGITNIKLWGNGWSDNSKYRPYSMGIAENGRELSLVYQCSKIVLGNNVMTTAAARAWETMLSGGFYMSNYIPREYDVCDIRKILKENEEIIIFKDNKDLIEKIKYYLNHENERQKMIEVGHAVSMKKMTYKALTEKMMRFVME